jgi:hypothetical protein
MVNCQVSDMVEAVKNWASNVILFVVCLGPDDHFVLQDLTDSFVTVL